jgi:hypothetical protein
VFILEIKSPLGHGVAFWLMPFEGKNMKGEREKGGKFERKNAERGKIKGK